MNFRNLLFAGAFVAMLGIGAAGCNENPTDNPPGTGPVAPTGLKASSQGPGSVKLTWTAATGATSYNVAWTNPNDAADRGKIDSMIGTTATVTGLTSGKAYNFTVTSVSASGVGSSASLTWAPANRFTSDQANTTTTIRIYEFKSAKGSGLILDPANGGPRNVSLAPGASATFGVTNLAMFLDRSAPGTFDIGPAYAFTEYAAADKFNRATFVSRTTFSAPSLNEWYLDQSLDKYIDSANGNISSFNKLGASASGQGFIVRTGTGSDVHYARVFVKSVGGNLLQGTTNDKYVELEVSYQSAANLPYAKRVAGSESPIGIYSTYNGR